MHTSSEIALAPTEFESTISVQSSLEEYERATGQQDVLFFFKDSSRLSRRRIERKVTIESKNVFGFCDGYVFPINRTSANETLCAIDEFVEVVKSTHRKITRLPNGVRVSYNKEECAKGVLCTVEYEIEYGADATHDDIVRFETLIMKAAIANRHFVHTTKMSLESIFACVMTKVQMWHCFDDREPYVWAYKWNGVKAKLIVHEDTSKAYLWRDASDINIVPFEGYHEFLKNLCMVVEIMDDIIVVIEIIGSQFADSNVYLSEPRGNIAMLDHLRGLMLDGAADASGTRMRVDGKPLVAQTFFDPPMPRYKPDDTYDGYIVVQNDLVIKWKIPTIDAKCVNGNLYTVADKYLLELDKAGERDAVYEISPHFKIIRKRNDRITSSGEQEYEIFMESIKMLSLPRSMND